MTSYSVDIVIFDQETQYKNERTGTQAKAGTTVYDFLDATYDDAIYGIIKMIKAPNWSQVQVRNV